MRWLGLVEECHCNDATLAIVAVFLPDLPCKDSTDNRVAPAEGPRRLFLVVLLLTQVMNNELLPLRGQPISHRLRRCAHHHLKEAVRTDVVPEPSIQFRCGWRVSLVIVKAFEGSIGVSLGPTGAQDLVEVKGDEVPE